MVLVPSLGAIFASLVWGVVMVGVVSPALTNPVYIENIQFTAVSAGTAAGSFIITVPAIAVGAFASFASVFSDYIPYIPVYVGVMGTSILLNQYDYTILTNADQAMTKWVFPFYNNTMVPVFRFIQILFDASICWVDLYITYPLKILSDVATTITACQSINWQDVMNNFLNTIRNFGKMVVDFIINEGNEPFEIYDLLRSASLLVNDTQSSFICECEMLDFAYQFVFEAVTDSNWNSAGDGLLNGFIYYPLNVLVATLTAFFNNFPNLVSCGPTTGPNYVTCEVNRQPKVDPIISELCNATYYSGAFLENSVNTAFNIFISGFVDGILGGHFGNVTIKFGRILGGLNCGVVTIIGGTFDLITHIDLIFSSDVKYLQHATINQLLPVALNISSGVDLFWAGFGDNETDALGCVFSAALDTVIYGVETLKDFFVALFYEIFDSNSLNEFFMTYDPSLISNSFTLFENCTVRFATGIDPDFGAWIEQVLDTINQGGSILYNFFLAFVQSIEKRKMRTLQEARDFAIINNYIINVLPGQVDILTNRTLASFAGLGNIFRKMDFNQLCVKTEPLYPPTIDVLTNQYGDFMCSIGNLVENFGQFYASIVNQLMLRLVDIYNFIINGFPSGSVGYFVHQLRLWVTGDITIAYFNFLNNLSQFFTSFIVDVECPCLVLSNCITSPPLPSGQFQYFAQTLAFDTINGTAGLVFAAEVTILVAADDVIAVATGEIDIPIGGCAPDNRLCQIEYIFCLLTTFAVDAFGNVFKIVVDFFNLLECMFGNNISSFTTTIYTVIFSPTNVGSLRNLVCTIVNDLIYAIQWIISLLTQGSSFILTFIGNIGIGIVNFFIGVVNTELIGNFLNDTIIGEFINQYIIFFLNEIMCFLSHIVGIFGDIRNGFAHIFATFVVTIDLSSLGLGMLVFSIPIPNAVTISQLLTNIVNDLDNLQVCSTNPAVIPPFPSIGYVGTVGGIPFLPTTAQSLFKRNEYEEMPISTEIYSPHNFRIRDYTNTSDFGNSTTSPFWDQAENITALYCGGLYEIYADNSSAIPAPMRLFFLNEYKKCLISVAIILPIDFRLFGNYTSDWITPTALYSMQDFVGATWSLGSKLYYPFKHELSCYSNIILSQLATTNYTFPNWTTYMNGSGQFVVDEACQPWDEYSSEMGVTSNWTIRLGEVLELTRELLVHDYLKGNLRFNESGFGFVSTGKAIISGIRVFMDLIFEPQAGMNQSLYESVFITLNSIIPVSDLYSKRGGITTILPSFIRTNYTNSVVLDTTGLGRWIQRTSDKIVYGLRPRTEKAVRIRRAMSDIRYVVMSVFHEYSYRLGYTTDKRKRDEYEADRNRDVLMSVAKIKQQWGPSINRLTWADSTLLGREKIIMAIENGNGDYNQVKRDLITDFINDTANGTICGIPLPDGQKTCINCTILFKIIDDFVSSGIQCVMISEKFFNLLENRFFSTVSFNSQNLFRGFEHISQSTKDVVIDMFGFRNDSLTRTFSSSAIDNGTISTLPPWIDPQSYLFVYLDQYVVVPVSNAILGVAYSIKYYISLIAGFTISISPEESNSIYFWLNKLLSWPASYDCTELAMRGFALGNLQLTIAIVLVVYIVVGIFFYKMAGYIEILQLFTGQLITILMLTYIPVVMFVNYGASPLSLAIPFCVADDLYEMSLDANVPCLGINTLFPGFFPTNVCPTVAADYMREFPDCSAAPFFFNNPWRIIFFTFEFISGSINTFLLNTDFILISWIRLIPSVSQMLFFAYEPGPIPEIYKSCFILRIHNYGMVPLVLVFLATCAVPIALILVALIILLFAIVYYGSMIVIGLASLLSNSQGDDSGYSNENTFVLDNSYKTALPESDNAGYTGANKASGYGSGANDDKENSAKRKKRQLKRNTEKLRGKVIGIFTTSKKKRE